MAILLPEALLYCHQYRFAIRVPTLVVPDLAQLGRRQPVQAFLDLPGREIVVAEDRKRWTDAH